MLTNKKKRNGVWFFLFVVWMVGLLCIGFIPDSCYGDTGTKNYEIKDYNGYVQARVHCEYGRCISYDTHWVPQYRWADPTYTLPDDSDIVLHDYDDESPDADLFAEEY